MPESRGAAPTACDAKPVQPNAPVTHASPSLHDAPPNVGASIALTEFARARHFNANGKTWFRGSEAELLALVQGAWATRQPGFGRSDLNDVVVVAIPTGNVVGHSVTIRDGEQLTAQVTRRRPFEDPYVSVTANRAPDPVVRAEVVLYSGDMIRQDGERDFNADWGVVSLNGSAIVDEPMHPLTMARNMLGKPGGSKAEYTAEQFAEAVYYWSQKAAVKT